MDRTPESIRLAIHDRYTGVAEAADSCCDTGAARCSCGQADAAELESMPAQAVASARGCGNPTELARLQPGDRVLDLGSGGGLDALLAARAVGPTGFVYGVDATPAMIDLARRNAARLGADNVEFRLGDIEALPLADQAVDVILSNCVVNLTPDKRRAFTEAFRVLRPGGRLAISDIVIDPDLDGLALSPDAIRRGLDWAGCAAGALTTAELRSLLVGAGFEQVTLKIDYRFGPSDLPESDDPEIHLTHQQRLQLAGRFTGTSISAVRPAAAPESDG